MYEICFVSFCKYFVTCIFDGLIVLYVMFYSMKILLFPFTFKVINLLYILFIEYFGKLYDSISINMGHIYRCIFVLCVVIFLYIIKNKVVSAVYSP